MRTSAALVVVVEKEGVFARLVEDGFAAQHNALIVTGKGFPDLATRAFLRLVHVRAQCVWGDKSATTDSPSLLWLPAPY